MLRYGTVVVQLMGEGAQVSMPPFIRCLVAHVYSEQYHAVISAWLTGRFVDLGQSLLHAVILVRLEARSIESAPFWAQTRRKLRLR